MSEPVVDFSIVVIGGGPAGLAAACVAAQSGQRVALIDETPWIGGQIWQMDMLTQQVTLSQVVGVHGCPRCGLRRPAEERTFAPLEKELAYLWADPVQER